MQLLILIWALISEWICQAFKSRVSDIFFFSASLLDFVVAPRIAVISNEQLILIFREIFDLFLFSINKAKQMVYDNCMRWRIEKNVLDVVGVMHFKCFGTSRIEQYLHLKFVNEREKIKKIASSSLTV